MKHKIVELDDFKNRCFNVKEFGDEKWHHIDNTECNKVKFSDDGFIKCHSCGDEFVSKNEWLFRKINFEFGVIIDSARTAFAMAKK